MSLGSTAYNEVDLSPCNELLEKHFPADLLYYFYPFKVQETYLSLIILFIYILFLGTQDTFDHLICFSIK